MLILGTECSKSQAVRMWKVEADAKIALSEDKLEIHRLAVHNYKSLRSVEFKPSGLTVLIGPNASGKSNFADAIDFLSLVYKHGLEVAVAIKGGYENIAFRMMRRSKAPISFKLEVVAGEREIKSVENVLPSVKGKYNGFLFIHEFNFRTVSEGIRSDFVVTSENLRIYSRPQGKRGKDNFVEEVDLYREGNRIVVKAKNDSTLASYFLRRSSSVVQEDYPITSQELFALTLPTVFGRIFIKMMSGMAVYQLSPHSARKPGVPTPNPKLSVHGENLPAVIDWLIRKRRPLWEDVRSAMREIVPTLEDITVEYLHTRTLGLFFKEEGFGRSWTSEDVSDGTIKTLAMLVATVDPSNTLLFIEEPENTIHPWIIKGLVNRFRSLSSKKPVIVTTHSPTLIDTVIPSEAWITFKSNGETHLSRLIDLDADIQRCWSEGKCKLSLYLDSGLVPHAVPGGAL